MPVISPDEDEKQASLLFQTELSKAIRATVQAVVHEPLPQRMILLLLRVAFSQTVRATLGRRRRPRPRPSDNRTDVRA
jgi:hypothetical protein